MKKISLDFKINVEKLAPSEKEFISTFGGVGVFENILISTVGQIYKEGLPLKETKLLARLQRKFEVTPSSADSIEVEDAEYDFLRDVFFNDQIRFSPAQSKVVLAIVENLEAVR